MKEWENEILVKQNYSALEEITLFIEKAALKF